MRSIVLALTGAAALLLGSPDASAQCYPYGHGHYVGHHGHYGHYGHYRYRPYYRHHHHGYRSHVYGHRSYGYGRAHYKHDAVHARFRYGYQGGAHRDPRFTIRAQAHSHVRRSYPVRSSVRYRR